MPAVQYTLHNDPVIVFSPDKNLVTLGDEEIKLEPLQARLLQFFIEQQGEVLSTRTIAENVWERSQVSDNLVRQVISLLRGQLRDKSRPYRIIQTIPKKGYLFNLEVSQAQVLPLEASSEPKPDEQVQTVSDTVPETVSNENPLTVDIKKAAGKSPFNTAIKGMAVISVLALGIAGGVYLTKYNFSQEVKQPSAVSQHNETIPVYLHQINLDKISQYDIAESIYNYLFYGLNSAKSISSYNYSRLNDGAKEAIQKDGFQIKSWIKENDGKYHLTIYLQSTQAPEVETKIEKEFDQTNFFETLGDIVLELKTIISPDSPDYEDIDHRITSVENYDDWQVISSAISLFFQGGGGEEIEDVAKQLNMIKAQGRDNYLVDGLLSYISSVNYLQSGNDSDRDNALSLAQEAFNKDPRCDIANLTLGLSLLLHSHSDQAYPYLFYASESAPSALSFYLLSVADKLSHNPRGSSHYHKRFTEMNKENRGKFYELMERLQKTNILQSQAAHKI